MESGSRVLKVIDARAHQFVQVDMRIFRMSPQIGGSAMLVYLALLSYTRPMKKDVYPGLDTLSDLTGLHRNTITESVKKLVELRLLSVERASSLHATNTYTILPFPGEPHAQNPGIPAEGHALNPGMPCPEIVPKVNKEKKKSILKNSEEEKKADPRLRPILFRFLERFKSHVGESYPVNWGRDQRLIKGALPSDLSVERAVQAVDQFFDNPNDWHFQTRKPIISTFVARLPALLAERPKGEKKQKFRVVLTPDGPKQVPA